MPVEVYDVDSLLGGSIPKRVENMKNVLKLLLAAVLESYIRFFTLSSEQTNAKYTDISKSFFQIIKVQIGSKMSFSAFAIAHNNARVAADASKLHPPLSKH